MTSIRYWQLFLGQTEPPQNLWQWVSWGVVIIVFNFSRRGGDFVQAE